MRSETAGSSGVALGPNQRGKEGGRDESSIPVMVVAPVRHWWAYTLAAYATSIATDVRAVFPVSAMLFIAAGVLEITVAAALVRRFANGIRAFDGQLQQTILQRKEDEQDLRRDGRAAVSYGRKQQCSGLGC